MRESIVKGHVQPSRTEQIRAARSPIASRNGIHRSLRFQRHLPRRPNWVQSGLVTPNAGRCLCDTAVAAVTWDCLNLVAARGYGGGVFSAPDVLTEGLVIMQNRERLRPWPVLDRQIFNRHFAFPLKVPVPLVRPETRRPAGAVLRLN